MSARAHPIVIAGGGIAGLAAAIALGRKGHQVVVAEKRAQASEAGAGLQLSPNASRVLLDWGLGPTLAEQAVAPSEVAIRRWGEPRAYARMPLATRDDDAPFWTTMRADLHAALHSAAGRMPTVRIENDLALEGLRDDGSGLVAAFRRADTRVEIEASCLVGADGQRSMARRLMGDARDLDQAGWEAWRTVLPADAVQQFVRAAAVNLWLGRDSHAVHYPVAAGRSINLVVIRRSGGDAEGWSREDDAGALAPLAASAAEPLRALIAAAPSWAVWTLRDRAPSPSLAKGAACLVGDAGHPVLPFLAQGAAMAIEDAAVLANALPGPDRFGRPEIETGLAAYAAARRGRTQRVFAAARSNAFAYHLPRPLAWLRDRRIGMLGPHGMRQRYSWLYDWRLPRQTP